MYNIIVFLEYIYIAVDETPILLLQCSAEMLI